MPSTGIYGHLCPFMDICRLLPPKTSQIFLSSHGTSTKIEHILGQNTYLDKFKRIEIQCLLSDHSGIKQEISDR